MPDTILANEGQILDRIQQRYTPEEMSQQELEDWLTMGPKGRHQVSKGEGKTRESEGKMLPSTRRKIRDVARTLSETKKVHDEIISSKHLKELRGLEGRAADLYVHSSTVEDVYEGRKGELRRIELEKKRKLNKIYRDELKKEDSEKEIDKILERAFKDIGEGKNYDSLEEASEILKERLK